MTLLLGDCLDVMPTLEAGSVDAVVCDPPYGLEFMGKSWDKLAPTTGRSMLRPTSDSTSPIKSEFKDGVGTRIGAPQKNPRCRICGKLQFDHPKGKCKCSVPDFNTRQSEYAFLNQVWHEQWAREAFRVAKPGAYLLSFGGTRTFHRLTCAIEDAGWIIRDCLVWAYASGFPKSRALLKPAWEPIVMARKPGPLRELAIDRCRIGWADEGERAEVNARSGPNSRFASGTERSVALGDKRPHAVEDKTHAAGRWPSNVILTDALFDGDTPGVVGGGEVTVNAPGQRSSAADGWGTVGTHEPYGYGDSGTYSRFFLIPKSARSEREPVLGGLPHSDSLRVESAHSTVCAKCGRQRVNVPGAACVCPEPEWVRKPQTARANSHPTVKPLDLMRHLVRLVTPTGGTVLDPFAGSGTTLLAAELEGFPWIAIEREAEYVAIIEARLNGTQRGLGLDVGAPIPRTPNTHPDLSKHQPKHRAPGDNWSGAWKGTLEEEPA